MDGIKITSDENVTSPDLRRDTSDLINKSSAKTTNDHRPNDSNHQHEHIKKDTTINNIAPSEDGEDKSKGIFNNLKKLFKF